jgi:hypothetical protein
MRPLHRRLGEFLFIIVRDPETVSCWTRQDLALCGEPGIRFMANVPEMPAGCRSKDAA